MSLHSNHYLECDYLSSSFCFATTSSPEVHPVSLYIYGFDRCIVKLLIIDLLTCRSSGILFTGYRGIQEKES